jgi:hypothetical protein
MKRRFISPLMFVYPIMVQEKPMEPVGDEDAVRALYAENKSIKDMEAVNIDVMTPKEYGIKKLTKKYKL